VETCGWLEVLFRALNRELPFSFNLVWKRPREVRYPYAYAMITEKGTGAESSPGS
jgi:hypothetical protein